ncbi:hypothetical protein [Methylocapsa aurea]|uniref:hypothetical protein n=1 Tax=Methylocapsa aurea TaxID=663610 RepID=UPI003D18D27D
MEDVLKKHLILIGAALGVGLGVVNMAVGKDEHDHMSMKMAPDTRVLLDFPDPMRNHMLSNMRGHLESLQEILAALAAGDGAKAGEIAEARLGLASPDAAACAKGEAGAKEGMGAMMAKYMPPEMRQLGFAMHESASAFAVEAAKMPRGGEAKDALSALSKVTQNCAACHSAYRLR